MTNPLASIRSLALAYEISPDTVVENLTIKCPSCQWLFALHVPGALDQYRSHVAKHVADYRPCFHVAGDIFEVVK